MKKMILLLLLPLTALMAIEFVMTHDGLVDAENFGTITPTQPIVTAPAPSTPSTYLETVNIPACDASNPEVHFINNNSDWSKINDSSKRIFCVSPGDYTSLGNIRITRSGTDAKRRYIVLNNGNDTHPGKLNKNQLANFALDFNNASFWIIDRASSIDNGATYAFRLRTGSSNNIFNRIFTNNIITSIAINADANDNTIQNSRFQNMTHSGRIYDNPAISFFEWSADSWSIKNTKIINNEIVNANDGMQIVLAKKSDGDYQEGNAEGTIIDGNDIYIDSNIYTNGNGKYDPNGSYAYAENALDIKAGSTNVSNPMIITNNHFWGFRKADSTDSYLSDPGHAFVIHYGIGNTKFNDNVIFDAPSGIVAADKQNSKWSMYDGEIKRNIIQDCGSTSNYALQITESNNISITDNVIVNARNSYLRLSTNGSGMIVTNNIGINSPDNQVLTNNTGGIYKDNSNEYTTGEAAGHTNDYTFTTDKYTNNPKVITLPNTVKAK